MKIDGYCDQQFLSVKHAFEKNFELGLECGGSLCIMDLEKNLSIGYAMNKMYMKGEDPRTGQLVKTVWDIINKE